MIALFDEFELPAWADALRSDRARVREAGTDAFPRIHHRFRGAQGLWSVSVGLGDRALAERLHASRSRLYALTAPVVPATPVPRDGIAASAVSPGALLRFGGIPVSRAGIELLGTGDDGRLRLVRHVWRPLRPVSIQEYRSVRRACVGWWMTLALTPVVSGALVILGAQPRADELIIIVAFYLMIVAATVGARLSRRLGFLVGAWDARSGQLVPPVYRGRRSWERSDQRDPVAELQRLVSRVGLPPDNEHEVHRLIARGRVGAAVALLVLLADEHDLDFDTDTARALHTVAAQLDLAPEYRALLPE